MILIGDQLEFHLVAGLAVQRFRPQRQVPRPGA